MSVSGLGADVFKGKFRVSKGRILDANLKEFE